MTSEHLETARQRERLHRLRRFRPLAANRARPGYTLATAQQLIMHMGRPVAQSASESTARGFALSRESDGAAPNRRYRWTRTGKLQVELGRAWRFTGWEVLSVPPVVAAPDSS